MANGHDQRGHRHAVTIMAAESLTGRRNGGRFIEDGTPDEIERTAPAIDLVGHDSVGTICLEHTLIEAYEGQVLDNRRAREVAGLIAKRLVAGLEPPGRYTLGLNTGDLAGLRRRDVAATVDALEAWIKEQRLPVPTPPPIPVPNHVVARSDQVPVRTTLYRMECSPEDDGRVVVAFQRDATIEGQRQSRIRKALVDKLPKLEAARIDGSITALVLEMSDYILSNRWEVARVFYATAQSVDTPLPDAVVLMDTSAGDGSWIDYTVKFGDWWCDAALDQAPPISYW